MTRGRIFPPLSGVDVGCFIIDDVNCFILLGVFFLQGVSEDAVEEIGAGGDFTAPVHQFHNLATGLNFGVHLNQ